jgi:hypothetical protein
MTYHAMGRKDGACFKLKVMEFAKSSSSCHTVVEFNITEMIMLD